MKKSIRILISILLVNLFTLLFSACDEIDYATGSIESVSLMRLGKNILDYRIIHEVNYSPGYKEKIFMVYRNEELDTKTINFSINKEIVFFNKTIPANENLWKNDRIKKHITFTKMCQHYSDLVFDSIFYSNSSIDTVGLVVTFKVKANDGLKLKATSEQ